MTGTTRNVLAVGGPAAGRIFTLNERSSLSWEVMSMPRRSALHWDAQEPGPSDVPITRTRYRLMAWNCNGLCWHPLTRTWLPGDVLIAVPDNMSGSEALRELMVCYHAAKEREQ